MTLPRSVLNQLSVRQKGANSGPRVRRGEEMFEGTDYPRTWDGFIGQTKAKEQLLVQAAAARARGTRVEHTLIANGTPGIGKTTLATLLAYQAGAGIVQTTGPLDFSEALRMMRSMRDNDILFVDEIHLLTQGGRNKADWLLPFMTEGKMYGKSGAIDVPNVALVGATTDVGRLPDTLVSRFMCQPTLVEYTSEEGAQIAGNLAGRVGVGLEVEHWGTVARAADNNPRVMRRILTQIRDLGFAYPDTHPNLDKALDWAGVSHDGLSQVARDILLLLVAAHDNTASQESLRAQLGEPGPIAAHEQSLLRRGYVTVTGRGRRLTEAGLDRASDELEARLAS